MLRVLSDAEWRAYGLVEIDWNFSDGQSVPVLAAVIGQNVLATTGHQTGRWVMGAGGRNVERVAQSYTAHLPDGSALGVFPMAPNPADPWAGSTLSTDPVQVAGFYQGNAADPDHDGVILDGDGLAGSQTGAELDLNQLSFSHGILSSLTGSIRLAANSVRSGMARVIVQTPEGPAISDPAFVQTNGPDNTFDLRPFGLTDTASGGILVLDGNPPLLLGVIASPTAATGFWAWEAYSSNIRAIELSLDYHGMDILGTTQSDTLIGSYGSKADRIDGGAGNDILDGGYADDWLIGGDGDDRLIESQGNDRLDGGAGNDLVQTSSFFRSNHITATAEGIDLAVTANGGETNHLTSVERIQFADGVLWIGEANPAAQVLRLYQAALDRLPDQGGLNFWIDNLSGGGALSSLAAGFLDSDEFAGRFGRSLDDAGFVGRLYQNVLGRAGEAGGTNYWTSELATQHRSRAEILTEFSESAENKAGSATLTSTGIWDRSETAIQITLLYDTVLGRLPDAGGLENWRNSLDNHYADLTTIAGQIAESIEFRQRYGTLDNRGFVEKLYLNTLDRAGDTGGIDFWTSRLDTGQSRASIISGFSESTEHHALMASVLGGETMESYGIAFT